MSRAYTRDSRVRELNDKGSFHHDAPQATSDPNKQSVESRRDGDRRCVIILFLGYSAARGI